MQNHFKTLKESNNLCVCGLHKRSALPIRGRALLSSVKGPGTLYSSGSEPCSFCQGESKISIAKDCNMSAGIQQLPEKLQTDPKRIIASFGNNFLKIVQDPAYADLSTWNTILTIWAPRTEDSLPFASKGAVQIKIEPKHAADCRAIGTKIKLFLEDYQIKYYTEKKKTAGRMIVGINSGNVSSTISQQKDSFLQEINFALFGTRRLNLPEDNNRDHHKLADAYCCLYKIPIKTDETSTKQEYRQPTNVGRNPSDIRTCKQPVLRDPAIISLSSFQSNLTSSPYHQSYDVSHSSTLRSSEMNLQYGHNNSPYRMAGPLMSSHTQASVVAQSISNATQLSKQQQFMQAVHLSSRPASTNYPLPSPFPGNSNVRGCQPSAPIHGPSYQENYVNAAIIQQHLYQQYNINAATSAGKRELLLYEQRLHQTQQIKTIIPQSQSEMSLSSVMVNNLMRTNMNTAIHDYNSPKKESAEGNPEVFNIGSNIPSAVIPRAATEKLAGTEDKKSENVGSDAKKSHTDEDTSEEEFFDSINQLCSTFN